MIVYRFAHAKYAADISGEGAKLWGGRWNNSGIPVLYTSEHISLGLLEVVANGVALHELQNIRLIEIELPNSAATHEVKLNQLKKEWWTDHEFTQWIGSEILQANQHLLIKCPSAIIPMEHNILCNPLHKDFHKVKARIADFRFDERLFKAPEISYSE
ncbi:RES family NAD+ phosphorylase [Filimonas effusa]|uniref:RES domain-containing protein n=1 Tax=Filimonas effusa TaxID=2508721 RepID=A0A4Q1DAK5_9BACT|nr:RES family NAD+ phosphorylase [Filimonas effusa]RXK86427.1 RES domain-containing protein [Filimonas effusa]